MLRLQIVPPFLKHYKHFISAYLYRRDNGCVKEGGGPTQASYVRGSRFLRYAADW